MRKHIHTTMLIATALFALACSEPEDRTAGTPALDNMKAEVSEAAEATGEYLEQTREQFMDSADKQFAALKDDWKDVEAKIGDAGDETQEKLADVKAELDQFFAETGEKLEKFKADSQQNWQVAREQLREDLSDIRAKLDEIKSDIQS